jgi:hypothetical protein
MLGPALANPPSVASEFPESLTASTSCAGRGEHYVPGRTDAPGRVGGTNGVTPVPRPNAEEAASRDALAVQLQSTGWSPLVCSLVARDG